MAARTGMATLIARLRMLTETTTADYTVGSVTYWSDDQLEDILDLQVEVIHMLTLVPQREWVAGVTEWHSYFIGYGNLEEEPSGSPQWLLTDSNGVVISNTLYSVDYQTGIIRFTADQLGKVIFLNWARSYNVSDAAAEVWSRKLAHVAQAYDFKAEDQMFSRSQLYDHYKDMYERFTRQGGLSTVPFSRSDLA
jgi:hypothetical protein